ncbi:MAG TPA: hypothetical protein VNS02_00070 [Rhizobiaceae bacterium]|nr:hypothetical protein [Rhizobiaceae bacterium]
MQIFGIPGWIWINLVLLVAATILVQVRLTSAGKPGRQKPDRADNRRAVERE